MNPLTTNFDSAALGRRHALLGMRCAGVVYAVIDQVEYERGFAEVIADRTACPPSEFASGSAAA